MGWWIIWNSIFLKNISWIHDNAVELDGKTGFEILRLQTKTLEKRLCGDILQNEKVHKEKYKKLPKQKINSAKNQIASAGREKGL